MSFVPPRAAVLVLTSALAVSACTTFSPETREQLDLAQEQADDIGSSGNGLSDATPVQQKCINDQSRDENLDFEVLIADAGAAGIAERILLTNIVIDCVPDLPSLPSYRSQFGATINSSLGAGAEVDAAETECLLRYILDNADDPGEAIADGVSDNAQMVYIDGVESCFDESTLAVIYGEPGSGPQNYGDDADLDTLYDQCTDGNERACDILYLESAGDSEYSKLATDCAGRGDGFEACVPGLDTTDDGGVSPDSPAMTALRVACEGGEMLDCDLLFLVAALDSEDAQFGYTCGGKIALGALPNCRTRFPSG